MTITRAIEASLVRASPFTHEIFEERWSAPRVVEFINERPNATIASVNSSSQPHAAVVIAACVDDEIFFTVHPDSVLHRNISVNDRIAPTISDALHAVMCQGRAVLVGPAHDNMELINRLSAATRSGSFTPPGWSGFIYSLELRNLVAN